VLSNWTDSSGSILGLIWVVTPCSTCYGRPQYFRTWKVRSSIILGEILSSQDFYSFYDYKPGRYNISKQTDTEGGSDVHGSSTHKTERIHSGREGSPFYLAANTCSRYIRVADEGWIQSRSFKMELRGRPWHRVCRSFCRRSRRRWEGS
jgi:hypothetical protein